MMAVVVMIGILSSIGLGKSRTVLEQARVARAIGDLRMVSQELSVLDTLPASLSAINRGSLRDPWGRPYQYLLFPPSRGRGNAPPAGARKDRFLVPINTRFDLYSMGADGRTQAPLTAAVSRDDIIVANDGGFVGRAVVY